jgi:hypothetical protein
LWIAPVSSRCGIGRESHWQSVAALPKFFIHDVERWVTASDQPKVIHRGISTASFAEKATGKLAF